MKQVLQSLKTGITEVAEIPCPSAGRGSLLISTVCSLVSTGTERMVVDFGKANIVNKARQQPEKVCMALDKVKTDGVVNTLEAVQSKLDHPLAPGYCNVGVVTKVGADVSHFVVGDRVVSNGQHAEIVRVPVNLCARIPDTVGDEAAAFTVLGAVGLQGLRLAQPTLGEAFAVTGVGLIGLLTVQLLRAQGCRVLAIDFDDQRLALARQWGADICNPSRGENPVAAGMVFSRGQGMDGVLITASTSSNDPVSQAAQMCRKRGRIILVGVSGLELNRADFYEKELTFQVSCSYGPGRYDPNYEENGQDYPIGYVRWTEQRNFEAVLDLMTAGKLDVAPLISHRFTIDQAVDAYELLSSKESSLGILLEYPEPAGDSEDGNISLTAQREVELAPLTTPLPAKGVVGFLGAGNYASRVLMPAFRAAGAHMQSVVSGGGVSAVHRGKKFGFTRASTDIATVLNDDSVDTVVIVTRHDAHAHQVIAALQAGKHVFCEKPLCLTLPELEQIAAEARQRFAQLLMVGFNRRFAPQVVRMRSLLSTLAEPKSLVMTVNAGEIPPGHWTQDLEVGGGRIIGEVCHFIDLLRHLVGAGIAYHQVASLGRHPALAVTSDKVTVTLTFEDGSVGTIHYLANGHRSFPKERLDVFCAGRVLQLDNFRRLRGWGWKGFSRMNLLRQDKGQRACVLAFMEAVRGGKASPIALEELVDVSRVTLELASAVSGMPIEKKSDTCTDNESMKGSK